MRILSIGTAVLLVVIVFLRPAFSQLANDWMDPIRADLELADDQNADFESRLAAIERILRREPQGNHVPPDREIAVLHYKAGVLYAQRRNGDRADNLERAITAHKAALRILKKSAFPREWATVQNELANAYAYRIDGDQADNLEKAIGAYKAALIVFTKDAFPQDWARTRYNLARAYVDRMDGSRADNLEKAIAAYKEALTIFTKETFPQYWAMTQSNVAIAYGNRVRGSRADNLEKAIAADEAALSVFTKDAFRRGWASTQGNLATHYIDRIRGSRADNLEKAIVAYNKVLSVFTKEAFPHDWAKTQGNLADAYSDRIRGSRADNLEKAIAAYKEALTIFTEDAFPHDWARAQNNLANAYVDSMGANRAKNLEKAIAAYEAALRVRTKDTFPGRWAKTQVNLANAYGNRIRGNRTNNLEKAITANEAALSVFNKNTFPRDSLLASLQLGGAFVKATRTSADERWSDADRAYADAIETIHQLIGPGLNEADTLETMSFARTLFPNAAIVALKLGDASRALQIVEEGRGRLLNLALRLDALSLNEEEGAKLRDLRQRAAFLERELKTPLSPNQREAVLEELMASRAAILKFYNRSPSRGDDKTGTGWTRIAPPPGGAFVIPVVADFGGALLIFTQPLVETEPHVVDLPNLTNEQLNEIFLGSASNQTGGWMRAYAINYLPRDERIARRAEWLTEINAIGEKLWPLLGAPLVRALEEVGVAENARIVLLPEGRLGTLPLWLIRNPDTGRVLVDHYEITTAPSLFALASIMTRPLSRGASQSLAGLIGPTDDLPYTPAEGAMVARWFEAKARHILNGAEATSAKAVLASLRGRSYWHLSTHGKFNWGNARESGLALVGGAKLTVGDLLSTPKLGEPELVMLSACETGLYDLNAPGEFIGLPAAFIQAGARTVIASLWPVTDASTALLMARFYDFHIGEDRPAAPALRAAQKWLREATRAELRTYLTEKVLDYADPRSADARRIALLKERFEGGETDQRPFAHPYYWGAFFITGADATLSQL